MDNQSNGLKKKKKAEGGRGVNNSTPQNYL